MIRIEPADSVKPLDRLAVTASPGGRIVVWDARGREIHAADGERTEFAVSGALGTHQVLLLDAAGAIRERASYDVHARTEIDDAGARFRRLLYMLECTFEKLYARERHRVFDGERVYRLHIITSRDTIHALKGAAYFIGHVRDVIDLFAEHQCDDGMIWDFGMPVNPDAAYHFEWRWPAKFHKRINRDRVIFARQPVMNDLEHMFIGGIHQIWRATGDDEWMAGKLDHGLRAMRYARTSPYTWSEKFQLIRRPYCLDLWDFQSKFDAAVMGGDEMNAEPGRTVYGVFHGDNTGMADSCRKLADMLDHVGRHEDAAEAREFGEHLLRRLEEVAWNGEFYTHHVSEDPGFQRDFGVDESAQVSLSNAYAVNRGIGPEKVKAIIETYLRIRREMPDDCPAEWFQMYPPFPRGWDIPPWVYTNGAVTVLVAGELAHGAFEHGYEAYAADILRRSLELFEPYGDAFIPGLLGCRPDPPERTFQPLDLREAANADLVCQATGDSPGWVDEPGNDMRELPVGRQELMGVPFDVLDAGSNGGRACLRLAEGRDGWAESAVVPVGAPLRSLYLLHARSGPGTVVGEIAFVYADGTREARHVVDGEDVVTFWNPAEPDAWGLWRRGSCTARLAWRGANESIWNVGLTARGLNNPHPDKAVDRVELRAAHGGAQWLVVAMTASDAEAFLPPKDHGGGAPPNWSAGALMYALAEGLVGVRDDGGNMNAVRIAPRWAAAGVDDVRACLKYAEGGGYVCYTYRKVGGRIRLELAGSGRTRRLELLLPDGMNARRVAVDEREAEFELRTVERSRYVHLDLPAPAACRVDVELET